MGCAVASAAMLGEMSYDEALARWPSPNVAWTRDPHNLLALLEIVTETQWQLLSFVVPNVRVNDFASCPWPVAAWIQDAALENRFGQWIVVDDQIVHDPGEWRAWTKDAYPLRDFFVGKVAQPVRPEVLFKNQTRRQADKIAQRWQPGSTVCQCLESDSAPNRRPGPSRPALQLRPALQFQGYFIGERDLASAPAVLVSCSGCGRPTEPGTVCNVCSAR
jgi:hypothetical protein